MTLGKTNRQIASSEQEERCHVFFLIPVYNDWPSLFVLLGVIDDILIEANVFAEVLVVDDASTIPFCKSYVSQDFPSIKRISILALKRNLGHQRAIAIGLSYLGEHYSANLAIVMDSDGEDRPEDAIQLIDYFLKAGKEQIVFARRSQRSESHLFRFFYYLYRHLYQLLTGYDIQVGNFSLIPFQFLPRLLVVSEIWTHYASGILKSGLPATAIPTRRGKRYHGKSKMNFTALVAHGLSAISVHGEKVGVRLLMGSLGVIMATLIMIFLVIGVRLTTPFAIPGWASSLVLVLIAVMLQAFIISLSFIFLVLIGKNNTSFIPVRDYHYFVLSVEEVI